uniref:Putative salivary secreted protein n=1 Tax=Ornithodoros parkeri TaxID=140564 RepID=A6N9U5_ORNPR|nr:putative salivary secreted protein [Ornithodoros parkeri]
MKLFLIGTLLALIIVVQMLGGGTQGAAVEEHMLEERSGSCQAYRCSGSECGPGCFCAGAIGTNYNTCKRYGGK